ncbi:hypothetical protein COB28_00215 [Candidatus Dependentiae bacterium]|nr:MAG: hypothetical protein COB28_00215 [Candidatus Dependentiae bacterium]
MFMVRSFRFLCIIVFGLFCTSFVKEALYAAGAESVEVATDSVTSEQAVPGAAQDSIFNLFDLSTWKIDSSNSWLWLLIASFLAGILISFTPCVYPMIPVTAAVMQNYASGSIFQTIIRSITYIMGIALVYASFGYMTATTSIIFGSWLQSPWLIGLIVSFYLYCAGAMFDWYDMYLPSFLNQQHGFASNGSLISIFLYGLLTGTFASPCVTPGLVLILGIVNQLKNPLLGFLMLFFFAIGMSLLLVLISLSTSFAQKLPHAGDWMLEIKKIFGFLLLAVTIPVIQRFLTPMQQSMVELSLLLIIVLFYLYQLKNKICCSSCAKGVEEVPEKSKCLMLDYIFIGMYTVFIVAGSIRIYYLLMPLFMR